MLRDGTAMMGRILFASAYGTSLDFNSKRWRLLADVLNDLAICIEIAAPLYPSYFVLLACIGSFLKAMYVGACCYTQRAFDHVIVANGSHERSV